MPTLAQTESLLDVQERLDAALTSQTTSASPQLRNAAATEVSILLDKRRDLIADLDSSALSSASAAAATPASFWATVLSAHGGVSSRIGLLDAAHLGALADVSVEEIGRGGDGGFRLVFEFRESKSVVPCVVAKEFVVGEVTGASRGKIVRGEMSWKEGVRERGGPFFEWLEGEGDVYGLGSAIKEQVVPRAVDLFFGNGLAVESGDMDDDEDCLAMDEDYVENCDNPSSFSVRATKAADSVQTEIV